LLITGIIPADWAASSKVVVHPSDVDLRDTIEIAEKERDRERARLDSSIGLLAMGIADERVTKILDRDAKRVESAPRTVDALTSWKSYYDRIFASSRFRIASSGCSLN
jgi:hypothetical protein